ncbi:hypothetical protein ABIB25_001433 [Nakamurella sp. UYEF19]|uniref:putative acetyltransferase n=1 Tax=Nakamurella sp. UYEF19 TaxID=1756392 RepID=UPI0033997708
MTDPRAAFLALRPGTRVVVRYRVAGLDEDPPGSRPTVTDALGVLLGFADGCCEIRTRGGVVTVPLAGIVAAKQVPPPPARRPRDVGAQAPGPAGGSGPAEESEPDPAD